MKKIMYPSAALLTAFALLSVQTAKADTAQASDQVNEPAATVEEVVASPTPLKIREGKLRHRLRLTVKQSLLPRQQKQQGRQHRLKWKNCWKTCLSSKRLLK